MPSIKLEAVLWGMDPFGDADTIDDGVFDVPLLADGRLDLAAIPERVEAAVMMARHIGRAPTPFRLIVGTIPDSGEPSLPVAIMRISGPNRAREWEFTRIASNVFGQPVAVAA